MCYTYDDLNRVTKRTVKDLNDIILSEESFTYDSAGNLTDAPDHCLHYVNEILKYADNINDDVDDYIATNNCIIPQKYYDNLYRIIYED